MCVQPALIYFYEFVCKVRQIKPSAMFFSRERIDCMSKGNKGDGDEEDGGVRWHVGGQYYRVCYSCHSSLTELMEVQVTNVLIFLSVLLMNVGIRFHRSFGFPVRQILQAKNCTSLGETPWDESC